METPNREEASLSVSLISSSWSFSFVSSLARGSLLVLFLSWWSVCGRDGLLGGLLLLLPLTLVPVFILELGVLFVLACLCISSLGVVFGVARPSLLCFFAASARCVSIRFRTFWYTLSDPSHDTNSSSILIAAAIFLFSNYIEFKCVKLVSPFILNSTMDR